MKPENQKPSYKCPRCGYETRNKTVIRNHFNNKKKPCQGILSHAIELTEGIKEHVLNHRLYVAEPSEIQQRVTNQVINYHNTVYNYVANIDFVEKLNKVVEHKNLEILDFETKVEELYQDQVERLEKDDFKEGFQLDHGNFKEIINTLTQAIRGNHREEFIQDINFIYDWKRKRIHVYGARWEEYLVQQGLTYLVDTIASYYLETYEVYLIRKLIDTKTPIKSRQKYKDCLVQYYLFLASFDVHPYVEGKHDNKILYNRDDPEFDQTPEESDFEEHRIVDEYMHLYNQTKADMTMAQKRKVQAEVSDILKSNTRHNIAELDKDIIGIINIDNEFKNKLLDAE